MGSYKYENIENSIHRILKESVSLQDDQKKKYNTKVREFFDALIQEMRRAKDFSGLFRQQQYVGSYYENLKIGYPDEFDVNLELVIPESVGKLKVHQSSEPGFCQLKLLCNESVLSSVRQRAVKRTVDKWCDSWGYILQPKVRSWMISIVDRAVNGYNKSKNKSFLISRSFSGPAVTLECTHLEDESIWFSVDFVPVFVFSESPYTSEFMEKKWYAVPKSLGDDRDFRMSFWHQEKELLSGTNQMKPVLKLMKKLRDDQNWKCLSSYHLKTMFLHKTAEEGKEFWSRGLGELFITMLKKLKHYLLVDKAIPFFWRKENNMLSQFHPSCRQNIGGFVGNMVEDIESNLETTNYIEKYFKYDNRAYQYTYFTQGRYYYPKDEIPILKIIFILLLWMILIFDRQNSRYDGTVVCFRDSCPSSCFCLRKAEPSHQPWLISGFSALYAEKKNYWEDPLQQSLQQNASCFGIKVHHDPLTCFCRSEVDKQLTINYMHEMVILGEIPENPLQKSGNLLLIVLDRPQPSIYVNHKQYFYDLVICNQMNKQKMGLTSVDSSPVESTPDKTKRGRNLVLYVPLLSQDV